MYPANDLRTVDALSRSGGSDRLCRRRTFSLGLGLTGRHRFDADIGRLLLKEDEAAVVEFGWHILARRAVVKDGQVLFEAIVAIGRDHIPVGAARRNAEAIDASFELGLDVRNCAAQGLALDEIIGQLINGPSK